MSPEHHAHNHTCEDQNVSEVNLRKGDAVGANDSVGGTGANTANGREDGTAVDAGTRAVIQGFKRVDY